MCFMVKKAVKKSYIQKYLLRYILVIILIIVVIWTIWGNTALMTNTITVFGDRILSEFVGFRIAHISDLHNAEFGENNSHLLNILSGLIALDQGFFPKYDGGLYTEGSTNMVVSRGIGNSIIPLRFNNRPSYWWNLGQIDEKGKIR